MTSDSNIADKILDAAIELAEQSSWESLCLHQIAEKLVIPLDDFHQYYPQKDDLVEAWYDRADKAMLQATQVEGYAAFSTRERLQTLIMAWLDFLSAHKKVSRDMLLYKLEPAHIHLQIQGLLRVSRTVQWIREAARLDSTHFARIAEEVGLTGIYLNTFVFWMFDQSEQQSRTRIFLDKLLSQAEKLAHRFILDTT